MIHQFRTHDITPDKDSAIQIGTIQRNPSRKHRILHLPLLKRDKNPEAVDPQCDDAQQKPLDPVAEKPDRYACRFIVHPCTTTRS